MANPMCIMERTQTFEEKGIPEEGDMHTECYLLNSLMFTMHLAVLLTRLVDA